MDGRSVVTSPDGTTIGYRSYGRGPGIVVVAGALHSGHHYEKLALALAGTFTVHAVDRRGRPGSGPQRPGHDIASECADVMAVLEKTESSLLFGHSSGGVVALQTALRTEVAKVAVYEPPVMFADSRAPVPDLVALEKAVAQDRKPDAFAILAKGEGGPIRAVPMPALRMLFRMAGRAAEPPVADYIDAVGTYPAEQRMIMALAGDSDRYSNVRAETLVLLGDRTGRNLARSARFLAETIPQARLEVMHGLGHDAPDEKAPERVAESLREFFGG